MLLLLGVRSCGGHRGLASRFGAFFQLAARFVFFVVRIKPHTGIDNRTRSYALSVPARSQFEFGGLCLSLTFGSSPRFSGYDRALHPRIVDIFVLEHCCAAFAAVEPRVVQRGRAG